MSMKNSNYTIGNLTRDLPTYSAVPQSTAPPRTPILNRSGGIITRNIPPVLRLGNISGSHHLRPPERQNNGWRRWTSWGQHAEDSSCISRCPFGHLADSPVSNFCIMRDFKLPPRCSWGLRPSGLCTRAILVFYSIHCQRHFVTTLYRATWGCPTADKSMMALHLTVTSL